LRCSRRSRWLILGARQEVAEKVVEDRGSHSHGLIRPLIAWSGGLALYVLALWFADAETAVFVSNAAWTVAPLAAAIAAWLTAQSADLTSIQRRAWRIVACACSSWLLGQLVWDYYTFFVDDRPAFPLLSKVLYLGYSALMLQALGGLSDSTERTRFTLQHLGNLGLIGCCLAVTIVLAFFEPAAAAREPGFAVAVALAHCTFVALTFFTALYYLWTHRWHATWIPMLLITAGTGTYSLGNFIYVHALLVASYAPADWVNASWVAAFSMIGLGAHLRRRPLIAVSAVNDADATARRSRQSEATIPAMLIILMVVVGLSASDRISTRVLTATGVLVLLFAFILGAREAWIQGEAQRLTRELRNANELLRRANLGLKDSEARVRDLNAHLEERVADRTRQLQSAYEELEGFTYAVAHDLKAPLRAIDGFAQLLDEAMHARADERSTAYLTRIRHGAKKMAALIEDLLAYSRMERRMLAPQAIELDKLVADELEELAQELRSYQFEVQVDVPPIRLHVDAEGLSLIVRNLLQNAIKFTRTRARAPCIQIRARSSGGAVEILVRDNGIGFDMQYYDQIFRLFHRLHRDTEYQGTGIGLALVHKALDRMQGKVRAQSKEGEGATFVIELPLEPQC
jgi:signal transduction histidine kinase